MVWYVPFHNKCIPLCWSRCEMPFNRFHIEQNWSHRQLANRSPQLIYPFWNWITEPEWKNERNNKQINHTQTAKHITHGKKLCNRAQELVSINCFFSTFSENRIALVYLFSVHNSQVLNMLSQYHGTIFTPSSPILMQTLYVCTECWAALCMHVCLSWDCVIVLRC